MLPSLIAETWLALGAGPDIDEVSATLGQDMRSGTSIRAEGSPPLEPETQRELNDDDDPNGDLPPTGPQSTPQVLSGGMTERFDAYENLSDEFD